MSVLIFECRGCGYQATAKWRRGCKNCGGLWSIVQRRASESEGKGGLRAEVEEGEVVSLSDVQEDVEEADRIEIGGKLATIDALLGGGIVPGHVILLCGPPGIGKSTIILQLLQQLAKRMRVVYAVGEESVKQVSRRSLRLGKFNKRLKLVRESDLDEILDIEEREKPAVMVVDSLQTVSCSSPVTGEELERGSTIAVKTATQIIHEHAMRQESTVFILVGHITKDGAISGPKALEHFVDVVLHFNGISTETSRTLRASKNREGSTGPLAVARFEMTPEGLAPVEEEKPAVPAEAPAAVPPSPQIERHLKSVPATDSIAPPPVIPGRKIKSMALISAALGVDCDVDGCGGRIDRACTPASGIEGSTGKRGEREAGLHESRVEKARQTLPKGKK